MKRLFSSLPLCVLLPGIALAGPPPADEYFPLEPGTRWTYLNQRFQTEIDAAVVSRDGEIVTYRIASIDYVLHDNGDEIDVQLEGGEFAPFYRFEEDSWVHRDPFGCEDQRTIHVISRNAELETPAGVLLDVLILEYGPAVCGDAGRITGGGPRGRSRAMGRVQHRGDHPLDAFGLHAARVGAALPPR